MEAIRILKSLQESGRMATPEEQAKLALYTGWGWALVASALRGR
jgi:hypothetical protein